MESFKEKIESHVLKSQCGLEWEIEAIFSSKEDLIDDMEERTGESFEEYPSDDIACWLSELGFEYEYTWEYSNKVSLTREQLEEFYSLAFEDGYDECGRVEVCGREQDIQGVDKILELSLKI